MDRLIKFLKVEKLCYNQIIIILEGIMAFAKIVFASMTGNTEEIADIVAQKLEELGHTVDVDECTTVDADEFQDADIAIVASYTYGDGELPDEIVDFMKICKT